MFNTYADADHGGDTDSGKLTTGYAVRMGTAAMSWSSKLQSVVALSTTEAEYVAAVSAGAEAIWKPVRRTRTSSQLAIHDPYEIHMDNQSAIQVAKNPEHHERMKHLDLRFHWRQKKCGRHIDEGAATRGC